MKKMLKFLAPAGLFLLLLLAGCSAASSTGEGENPAEETVRVTDLLGREVTVKKDVEKVVAIGPGALRLYLYVGDTALLAGVEQIEKDDPAGKPYLLANLEIQNLPVIGPGGPNTSPDAEKILAVKPDVIFTTYTTEKSAADELQAKTKIPVIALDYGETSVFDPVLYESVKLIGKVIGKEKRAEEVVAFFEEVKEDLHNRTKNIPEEEKYTAYIGALGFRGSHGITSTRGDYPLFNAVHAVNVVDETGRTGGVMIDKEKLLEWDPDKIFLDLGGLALVIEDYKKNKNFYRSLTAFKEGEIYSQLPYNFYSTNIDTALADAYYIGKVLYPERFSDINPEEKADEIYEFLVGKKLYKRMVEDFEGGFGKIPLQLFEK